MYVYIYTGESYTAGDVVGCMIELTQMPPEPIEPRILNEGTKWDIYVYVYMYMYAYIYIYIYICMYMGVRIQI